MTQARFRESKYYNWNICQTEIYVKQSNSLISDTYPGRKDQYIERKRAQQCGTE